MQKSRERVIRVIVEGAYGRQQSQDQSPAVRCLGGATWESHLESCKNECLFLFWYTCPCVISYSCVWPGPGYLFGSSRTQQRCWHVTSKVTSALQSILSCSLLFSNSDEVSCHLWLIEMHWYFYPIEESMQQKPEGGLQQVPETLSPTAPKKLSSSKRELGSRYFSS